MCQENLGKWLFKLLLSGSNPVILLCPLTSKGIFSQRTADLWIFSLFQTITFLPHSEAQFKFHQAVLTVSAMNVSKSKCIAAMRFAGYILVSLSSARGLPNEVYVYMHTYCGVSRFQTLQVFLIEWKKLRNTDKLFGCAMIKSFFFKILCQRIWVQ